MIQENCIDIWGSSIQIGERIQDHIYWAKTGKPGYLYNSMRYHGISNFSIAVLDFCPGFSESSLRKFESFLIILLNPSLNMTDLTTGHTGGKPAQTITATNLVTGAVVEFPSQGACSRYIGVAQGTISSALRSGNKVKKTWIIKLTNNAPPFIQEEEL